MAVYQIAADYATLTLNGDTYKDFEEGDIFTLSPVNAHSSRQNGASRGSVTIARRSDSGVHDLVIRVTQFRPDDARLQAAINAVGVTQFTGSIKEAYTVDGVDSQSTTELVGGSITTQPTSTTNTQDGNALMEYTIQFREVVRTL